jgi:peptidoglycan/LPS O-acetylase OafA/YrhL
MERNMELDRLRAVAALMTLYMHYRQVFYPWNFTLEYRGPDSPLDLLSNAWAGVDLFFVISGYIISKMIVTNFDQYGRSGERLSSAVIAFYVRRVFRIYPVAWFIVLCVIASAALLNDSGNFASVVTYLKAGVGIFTYTFNYWFPDNKSAQLIPVAPYWSLSVEEQFYLLYPLFLLLVASTRQRVLALAGALVAISLVIRPLSGGNPLHQFFYTQSRCDGLIYGCLLYFASVQPWFRQVRQALAASRWLMRAVVVMVSLVIASVPAIGFSNTFTIPVVCLLSAVLVGIAACEAGAIDFPSPVRLALDFVGRRSYTIYLIHIPLFYLTCELMYRYCRAAGIPISSELALQYALTFAVLMLVSTEAVYRLLERPMIRRGQRTSARILDPLPVEPRRSEPALVLDGALMQGAGKAKVFD